MTDINNVAWAGVASLLIHLIQGGIQLARHFRLTSDCCGHKSGISWDVGTPEDKSSTAETGGIVLAEPPPVMKRVSFRSLTPLPPPLAGRPGGE